MLIHFLTFVAAFVLATLATPIMRRAAFRLGCVHYPKKISIATHVGGIPYLGGAAIFAAFAIVVFTLAPRNVATAPVILLTTLIVVFGGLIDDVRALSVPGKLLAQVVAVFTFLVIGVDVLQIPQVFGISAIDYALAFLGIVGIINAMNFLDIMDGLAAGVAAIAAIGFGVIALRQGQLVVAQVAFALAGATAGFLLFNFNPARIFMGDTGSQFLGFMLAIFPPVLLKEAAMTGGNTPRILLASMVVLAIPLFEFVFTCTVRLLTGKLPWKGSKDHYALRAFAMGYSVRQIVLVTYAVGIGLATVGALLLTANIYWMVGALSVLALAFLALAVWLKQVPVPSPLPANDAAAVPAVSPAVTTKKNV